MIFTIYRGKIQGFQNHPDFLEGEIIFDPLRITYENMLELVSGKISKERLQKELEVLKLSSTPSSKRKSSPKKNSPLKSKTELTEKSSQKTPKSKFKTNLESPHRIKSKTSASQVRESIN